MCGIVAAISKAAKVSEVDMSKAVAALIHRGPDVQNVWMSSEQWAALGHARLSIIGLANGKQPIPNEDRRLQLVCNGEFYDFERIRAELQRKRHRFLTESDSEIAIHLFEDRGPGCLDQLRGEFAFAIIDERTRTLFAARDRFGIKPLYYTFHEGACYIASEIKAFRRLGVPLHWDREVLYDTQFVATAPDRTLCAGVYQLPPGHFLETDGERLTLTQYWDWNFPLDEPSVSGNGLDQRNQFQNLLEESIKLRLRADVPVACYLSGGLDSSAVLGLAAPYCSHRIHAFTLSFDHRDYDEVEVARSQAKLADAIFHPIEVQSKDLADHFAATVYHAERPIANAHAVAKFMLSRKVRDSGFKVVLTGEGGDELLAGYPEVRRDYSNCSRQIPGNAMLGPATRRLGYVPANMQMWAQLGESLLPMMTEDFAAEFAGRNPYSLLLENLDVEGKMAGRHVVNQTLYLWAKTMLPNYILCCVGDRMEMAHSIEGRVPLLDHHLAEFAAHLPISAKINGATEKYILRQAARPVITDAVYRREKQAFVSPPATFQPLAELSCFIQDVAHSSAFDSLGIYKREKVVTLLNSVGSMDRRQREHADALLMWITSLALLQNTLSLN